MTIKQIVDLNTSVTCTSADKLLIQNSNTLIVSNISFLNAANSFDITKRNCLGRHPGRKATRQVLQRQDVVGNGAGIGYTYHNNITVESDVVAIRPIFNNLHSAALTGVKFSIAPTANFSNPIVPTGAWIDGTSGNLASTTVTVNAWLGAADQPSFTVPDWVRVNSVAPTDGSGLRYFCIRHFVPASNTSTSESHYSPDPVFTTPSSLNQGRIFQTYRQNVDGVTTKSNFTSNTIYTKTGLVMGWEYLIASGEIITIAGFGDSITEGAVNGASNNYGNGWIWQLVKAFRQAYPNKLIEFANMAQGSTTGATYTAIALDRIPKIDPDIVIFHALSPNDGVPSAAITSSAMTRLASIYSAVTTQGSSLIVIGQTPNTIQGWTPTQDAFRRYANLQFQGSRYSQSFVDMDADLWDGTSAFIPATTTDGTHINEYGAGLVAINRGMPSLNKVIFGT